MVVVMVVSKEVPSVTILMEIKTNVNTVIMG
jgi:hypothetical protein